MKTQGLGDVIEKFIDYMKDSDIKLVKNTIPKYWERLNEGSEGKTIVRFNFEMKNVSKKDIQRQLNLFFLEYDLDLT